ncbi:hypothetical protein YQE_04578, partial [Dendroctonus ponderosae]
MNFPDFAKALCLIDILGGNLVIADQSHSPIALRVQPLKQTPVSLGFFSVICTQLHPVYTPSECIQQCNVQGTPSVRISTVISNASYVSVLTVVAFSTERYIAICYPLYLRAISGLQRAVWVIAGLWIVSFFCALPFAAYTVITYVTYPYNSTNIVEESAMCAMVNQPKNIPLTELSSLIFFIVPTVIIAVLYCNMGITIAKASRTKFENKVKGSIHRKNKKHQNNKSIIRML